MENLRQKIIKGGTCLLVRQAIGIIVSIAGVLLVTRVIGPRAYGIYATAFAIVTFFSMFGNWGLNVYLLRKIEKPTDKEFHQALTLLLLLAVLYCMVIIAMRNVVAAYLRIPEESTILLAMVWAIPLNLLAQPAIVILERDLNFRQVAVNELIAQIAYYAFAVPISFLGYGAWAPTAGFLIQQFFLLLQSYAVIEFRPAFHWESKTVKQMLRYGLSYSISIWVYQLKSLISPIVVGRFLGAEAVGYIAVSLRMAELLSFAKRATWRIAIPGFAHLNNDTLRFNKSIAEGMRLQAIAVGMPLAIFTLLAPSLITIGFGQNWIAIKSVFLYIAIGCLTNAMFNLHASFLYFIGSNILVTWFGLIYIVLFSGSVLYLVPHIGIIGYGCAEIISMISYITLHAFIVYKIGRISYGSAIFWYAISIFIVILSTIDMQYPFLLIPLMFIPLLLKDERRNIKEYLIPIFSAIKS